MDNRAVLVTGASSEVGKAIVGVLQANYSFPVFTTSRTDIRLPFDLTKEEDASNLYAQVGEVDLLVTCAGGSQPKAFDKQSLVDIRIAWETNFLTAYNVIRAFLPGMLSRGYGRVIAIGSYAALRGVSKMSAYSAAKHALAGLIKSLALEYSKSGVTFNMVCPGYLDTEATYNRVGGLAPILKEKVPLGRFSSVDEVAQTVLWIVGSSTVTGQCISVDGGLTA